MSYVSGIGGRVPHPQLLPLAEDFREESLSQPMLVQLLEHVSAFGELYGVKGKETSTEKRYWYKGEEYTFTICEDRYLFLSVYNPEKEPCFAVVKEKNPLRRLFLKMGLIGPRLQRIR